MNLHVRNISFNETKNMYTTYSFQEDSCGHAVLIVGYDDEKDAFKIVNSWGSDWGDEGYGWVSYDFFLPSDHLDFQPGIEEFFVTFDDENTIEEPI